MPGRTRTGELVITSERPQSRARLAADHARTLDGAAFMFAKNVVTSPPLILIIGKSPGEQAKPETPHEVSPTSIGYVLYC
jgi:hypothetical protein